MAQIMSDKTADYILQVEDSTRNDTRPILSLKKRSRHIFAKFIMLANEATSNVIVIKQVTYVKDMNTLSATQYGIISISHTYLHQSTTV